MSINKTIYNGIKNSEDLNLYGLNKDDIEEFLLEDLSKQVKKHKSRSIADKALKKNGKWTLSEHLINLMEIESHHDWSRDHVIHSVLTYLLGIYIQENFMVRLGFSIIEPLEWKTAALLHDIGYPLETAVNKIMQPFGKSTGIQYLIDIKSLINLKDGRNGSLLISDRINSWHNEEIIEVFNQGEINPTIKHGKISSIIVLSEINKLYVQKPNSGDINWDFDDFNKFIVNACAAICVHDIDNISISYEQAPTAFLLKLCDSFQEWSRPGLGIEEDNPCEYEIKIENNSLIFYAPTSKLTKIENEINMLQDNKIRIELRPFKVEREL